MLELPAHIVSEIRSQVVDGSYEPGTIVESIMRFFGEELGLDEDDEGPSLNDTAQVTLRLIRVSVQAAVAEHRTTMAAWTRPTGEVATFMARDPDENLPALTVSEVFGPGMA